MNSLCFIDNLDFITPSLFIQVRFPVFWKFLVIVATAVLERESNTPIAALLKADIE